MTEKVKVRESLASKKLLTHFNQEAVAFPYEGDLAVLGPPDGQRKLFACWAVQRDGRRQNVSRSVTARSCLWEAAVVYAGRLSSNVWILLKWSTKHIFINPL